MLFYKLILKCFSKFHNVMHITFLESCKHCCCILWIFESLCYSLSHSWHLNSSLNSSTRVFWLWFRSCFRSSFRFRRFSCFWSSWSSSRLFWSFLFRSFLLYFLSSLFRCFSLFWSWSRCCRSWASFTISINYIEICIYLHCVACICKILFNYTSSWRSNVNLNFICLNSSNYLISLNEISWFL